MNKPTERDYFVPAPQEPAAGHAPALLDFAAMTAFFAMLLTWALLCGQLRFAP